MVFPFLVIRLKSGMYIQIPQKKQIINLSLNKPDTVGAIASGLCLIHCLFTPLLYAIQGLSSGYGSEMLSWWKNLDLFFLTLSVFAIYRSTRISNNSATLIDHIYTNATLNNFETFIILSDISDHFPICHIISDKTKEKKPNYIQVQNFNEENISYFKEDLSNTNWGCVFDQDHTQIAYDKFYEIFSGKYNNHFPIRNVKFNKNKHKIDPFMSSAILKSRKTKFKLSETKIRCPSQENINKYKQFRKCYNKVIRAAKKGYYKKTFDQIKNNLRKTWEVLKDAIRKKNDKSSIIEEIKSDNLFYRNDNDMSNKFNEYFTTIADKITDDLNTSDRDCTLDGFF